MQSQDLRTPGSVRRSAENPTPPSVIVTSNSPPSAQRHPAPQTMRAATNSSASRINHSPPSISYAQYMSDIQRYADHFHLMQRKIAVSNDEIGRLREAGATNESILQALHSEIDFLQNENKRLQEEKDHNFIALSEKCLEINQLQTDNADLTRKISGTAEELRVAILKQRKTAQGNAQLSDAKKKLKEQLLNERKLKEELAEQVQSSQQKVEGLETLLGSKDQEVAKLQQQQDSMKSIYIETSAKVQGLIQTNTELKEESQRLTSNLSNLKAESQHATQVNGTLQDQLRIYNQRIRDLEASVRKCKSREDEVDTLKRTLMDKEETIEKIVVETDTKVEELVTEIDTLKEGELRSAAQNSLLSAKLEKATRDLEEQREEADLKLQTATSEQDKLVRSRNQLRAKIRKMNDQLTTFKLQNREFKKLVTVKDQEIVKLQRKCESLERTHSEANSRLQNLIQEKSDLQSENKISEDQVEPLKQELESAVAKTGELEAEIDKLKINLNSKSSEILQLEELEDKKEAKIRDLQTEINGLHNQLQETQQEMGKQLLIISEQLSIVDRHNAEAEERQQIILKQANELEQHQQTVELKNAEIALHHEQLASLREELEEKQLVLEEKHKEIIQRRVELVELSEELEVKDEEISTLRDEITTLNNYVADLQDKVDEQDSTIEEQKSQMQNEIDEIVSTTHEKEFLALELARQATQIQFMQSENQHIKKRIKKMYNVIEKNGDLFLLRKLRIMKRHSSEKQPLSEQQRTRICSNEETGEEKNDTQWDNDDIADNDNETEIVREELESTKSLDKNRILNKTANAEQAVKEVEGVEEVVDMEGQYENDNDNTTPSDILIMEEVDTNVDTGDKTVRLRITDSKQSFEEKIDFMRMRADDDMSKDHDALDEDAERQKVVSDTYGNEMENEDGVEEVTTENFKYLNCKLQVQKDDTLVIVIQGFKKFTAFRKQVESSSQEIAKLNAGDIQNTIDCLQMDYNTNSISSPKGDQPNETKGDSVNDQSEQDEPSCPNLTCEQEISDQVDDEQAENANVGDGDDAIPETNEETDVGPKDDSQENGNTVEDETFVESQSTGNELELESSQMSPFPSPPPSETNQAEPDSQQNEVSSTEQESAQGHEETEKENEASESLATATEPPTVEVDTDSQQNESQDPLIVPETKEAEAVSQQNESQNSIAEPEISRSTQTHSVQIESPGSIIEPGSKHIRTENGTQAQIRFTQPEAMIFEDDFEIIDLTASPSEDEDYDANDPDTRNLTNSNLQKRRCFDEIREEVLRRENKESGEVLEPQSQQPVMIRKRGPGRPPNKYRSKRRKR